MRLKRWREGMAAGAVGDEIEVVGLGRPQRRFNRCASGIGDRRWWQPIDFISIISRLAVDLFLLDRMVEHTLAAHEPVDDGGVGLEPHFLPEAVLEHARDALAFIGAPGFLLHDGGQNQRLFRRRHHDIRVARRPHLGEELRLGRLHAFDDVFAGVIGTELVGVRQEAPFRRYFGDLAAKLRVGHQSLHDLVAGQALGQRDLVLDRLALDQRVKNVAHGRVFTELVLAGLQAPLPLEILEVEDAGHENAPVGDNALLFETLGGGAPAFALWNGEDGRGGERPRLVELDLDPIEGTGREARQQKDKGHEPVEHAQERMRVGLRLVPVGRRLGRPHRLKGLGGAARQRCPETPGRAL